MIGPKQFRGDAQQTPVDAENPTALAESDNTADLEPATSAACQETSASPSQGKSRMAAASHVLAYGVLPAIALVLAMAAGYLKWTASSARDSDTARIESVQAATDGTIKLLSYHPDTVERDIGSARDLLSGSFRDSYSSLTDDVVIPGAKQKQISALATVPGATSMSASRHHAVVLVFVNQSVIVGKDAPSSTTSAVKVTLDKSDGRWLISDFTPV
jgi:Mce-associated membrane protein